MFLRRQHHADADDQRDFAALLGTVSPPHRMIGADGDAALPIDSDHSRHAGIPFDNRNPSISVLRAITPPSRGGASVWANTVRAYETLPAGLRALADGPWAVSSKQYDNARSEDERRIGAVNEEVEASPDSATGHPIVRMHPETGERTLGLGHFVWRLAGLSTADSNDLLALFQRHLTRLDNTLSWTWYPGDVAILGQPLDPALRRASPAARSFALGDSRRLSSSAMDRRGVGVDVRCFDLSR